MHRSSAVMMRKDFFFCKCVDFGKNMHCMSADWSSGDTVRLPNLTCKSTATLDRALIFESFVQTRTWRKGSHDSSTRQWQSTREIRCKIPCSLFLKTCVDRPHDTLLTITRIQAQAGASNQKVAHTNQLTQSRPFSIHNSENDHFSIHNSENYHSSIHNSGNNHFSIHNSGNKAVSESAPSKCILHRRICLLWSWPVQEDLPSLVIYCLIQHQILKGLTTDSADPDHE